MVYLNAIWISKAANVQDIDNWCMHGMSIMYIQICYVYIYTPPFSSDRQHCIFYAISSESFGFEQETLGAFAGFIKVMQYLKRSLCVTRELHTYACLY